MKNFILYILPIIEIILGIGYMFILKGDLSPMLSVIYTILSLIIYIHICQDNIQEKKSKVYNIRNFFILVFINILFLPYISNPKTLYITLAILFLIGLLLTLVIFNIEYRTKSEKKTKEIYKYILLTLGVGIMFHILKIIVPYLHKTNILFLIWVSIFIYVAIAIRKK